MSFLLLQSKSTHLETDFTCNAFPSATPDVLNSQTRRDKSLHRNILSLFQIPLSVLITVIILAIFVSPLLGIHPFTQVDYQYNALASAAYLATSHVLIACSVAVAVVACGSGYGGNVSTEILLNNTKVRGKSKVAQQTHEWSTSHFRHLNHGTR